MLTTIEEGAEWPTEMKESRAAFMCKDEEDALNPLPYRVLLMLPAIYRLWGRTRLAPLQPWIAEWATPDMFASVEGQGAEEAAYNTAMFLEHCKLNGTEVTGGAADMYKIFDQVQRDLLYKLLEKADKPKGILDSYSRFFKRKCQCTTRSPWEWRKGTTNRRASHKEIHSP